MKILSARKYGVNLKATIQATGKLGFSKTTSDILNFETKKHIKFAQSDNGDELYLVVSANEDDDAFKLIMSSGYYSLNTKGLFDALNYDYKNKNKTIIFDLQRIDSLDSELNGEVYRMNYRELCKNDKDMES